MERPEPTQADTNRQFELGIAGILTRSSMLAEAEPERFTQMTGLLTNYRNLQSFAVQVVLEHRLDQAGIVLGQLKELSNQIRGLARELEKVQ